MKFFKTLKRKAGNAILPVVGTILGLTILAGAVVGVALHSTKMVYRQDTLENQNDARQILYIASKYFCAELNKGRSADGIAKELKGFFGEGLKVTQDKTDTNKYYIWYPNKYKTGNTYTTDDNVAEWLKATINKKDVEDDDGDHGNNGINNTLFKQEAKLDEKYAIGNMMTVYMTDEGLLPGRKYSINEVSLVESDIDTFDEAFTYMNNTGVLEVDDIAVALYKLKVLSDADAEYIEITGKEMDPENLQEVEKSYAIVYRTGNLGGNYKWQDNGTTTDTWIYRQEYDLALLVDMVKYYNPTLTTLTVDNITYSYNEVNDRHTISSSNSTLATALENQPYTTFTSSRKFAEKIADYIFWKNIPLLCMNIKEVKEKFYSKMDDDLGGYQYTTESAWLKALSDNYYSNRYYYTYWVQDHDFEWTNQGVNVHVYWKDYEVRNLSVRWYRTASYTFNDICNFLKNNFSKFTKNGQLDYQLVYNAVKAEHESDAIIKSYGSEYQQIINYYKNNGNMINEDIINTIWGAGNGFKNEPRYTEAEYLIDKELRVRRYTQRDNWQKINGKWVNNPTWEQNDNGSYFNNFNLDQKKSWSDWTSFYNGNSADKDATYFRDSNYYLNPNFYSTGDSSTPGPVEYQVSIANNNKLVEQVIEYLTEQFKEKIKDIDSSSSLSELPGKIKEGSSSNYTFEGLALDGDSDQLIYMPQVLRADNGGFKIQYRYKVIVRNKIETKNGTNTYVSKFKYEVKDWLDEITMTFDQFFTEFAEGIIARYDTKHSTTSQINHIINKEELVENYIKQLMVEPLRYQYMPNSTLDSIVGDNTINGLREQQIANKLLIAYFEKCKDQYVTVGTNANYNYNFDILESGYQPYTGDDGMLNYVIKFKLQVDTNGNNKYDDSVDVEVVKEVSFIIGYLTYSPLNNPKLNTTTGAYTEEPNTNVHSYTDTDNTQKIIFSTAAIKNSNTDIVKYDQLVNDDVSAIISCVPFKKRVNSTQVPYGDHRITIDGKDYTVVSSFDAFDHYNSTAGSYEELIDRNVYYKGDISYSNYNFYIKKGMSLFIDGNLTLKNNADLTLEEDAMIFVNGTFRVEYDVKHEMSNSSNAYGKTWSARQLTTSGYDNDYDYFKSRGVDIYADANAKIIVNGDFEYKGCKYKYASSNSFNITIANDKSGLKYDRVYEQYVLNTGFGSNQTCTQNDPTKEYSHYTYECRSALEGVYIVNGDIKFLANNEKLTAKPNSNKWYCMYSNAYSNPIVNATFYAAGAFDMTGLWTAGLYDKCRANFVFAKSIVEPYLQLNTIRPEDQFNSSGDPELGNN
jgi:hypothetical protein